MASIEAAGAGSSNVLQVDGNNDNGADDRYDDSFQSAQTAVTTSSAATTSVSVTSESNLLVPGAGAGDHQI